MLPLLPHLLSRSDFHSALLCLIAPPSSLPFFLLFVLQKLAPYIASSSLCSSKTDCHAQKKGRLGQAGREASATNSLAASFNLIHYPADSLLTPGLVTVYYTDITHHCLCACVCVC